MVRQNNYCNFVKSPVEKFRSFQFSILLYKMVTLVSKFNTVSVKLNYERMRGAELRTGSVRKSG
jgi:hypothetical protein